MSASVLLMLSIGAVLAVVLVGVVLLLEIIPRPKYFGFFGDLDDPS